MTGILSHPRYRAAALSLLLLASCATQRPFQEKAPPWPEEQAAAWFKLEGTDARLFSTLDGQVCGPAPREVRQGIFGWDFPEARRACRHDTLLHGLAEGWAEFRFRAPVPADGSYLVSRGRFGIGAWGTVMARGAALGRFHAAARVELRASSPSCQASWEQELASASVAGDWTRAQEFAEWVEPLDLHLVGCRAGEPIELRLRILAEATRGNVVLEWFGFTVYSASDADRLFALRHDPGPIEAR